MSAQYLSNVMFRWLFANQKLGLKSPKRGEMEIDITGQRFGELTALRRLPDAITESNAKIVWLFRCDCGNETAMRKQRVTSGRAKRCNECRLAAITTHGMSRSREFRRFNQAKARCTNPNNDRYKDYGGRGIEWRFESYEQAYAELGPCPAGLTLDRIDNNGHYELGNVRWATWKQQFASRRSWNWNKKNAEKTSGENSPFFRQDVSTEEIARLYAEGKRATELGRIYGVSPSTIHRRMNNWHKKQEVLVQAA